ncbi:MAG: hypothetical protein ACOCQR_02830 [bacterium]
MEKQKKQEKNKQTTIYLPMKLYKDVKIKMIENNEDNLSKVVRELLEHDYLSK